MGKNPLILTTDVIIHFIPSQTIVFRILTRRSFHPYSVADIFQILYYYLIVLTILHFVYFVFFHTRIFLPSCPIFIHDRILSVADYNSTRVGVVVVVVVVVVEILFCNGITWKALS